MRIPSYDDSISSRPDRRHPAHRAARGWPRIGRWALALLLCAPAVRAGDYPMETIDLRARFPDELIPILQPLAGPDGTLVGAGHTLFVRASPARLADIRRALVALDQPPRSLLIQVRQSGSAESAGVGAGVRIDRPVGADGSGRLRLGPPGPGGDQAGAWAAQAIAGRDSGSRSLAQEVRALDGHPAFIAVGREQPQPYREIVTQPRSAGRGATLREGTVYRRAESGFSVVPRVLGETVTLEVSAGTLEPDRRGGLATSSAGSLVRGRLGEWIPLGSSQGSEDAAGAGLLYRGQGQRRVETRIELRVLPLD